MERVLMTDVLIPLRNRLKQIVATAVVDLEDIGMTEFTWCRHSGGYVVRVQRIDGKQVTKYLHIEIMQPPKGITVDHFDGDPLNNRRSNLRLATYAQQQHNQGCYRTVGRTSVYRGVSWKKDLGRWVAQACIEGENHYLGLYDDEEEAAAVARKFRLEHMEFTNEDRYGA